MGFEPTTSKLMIDFQDQRFKPLSHLSYFGVIGFEPMIMVPKTNALPLGYTPNFQIKQNIFSLKIKVSTFKLISRNIHTNTQI